MTRRKRILFISNLFPNPAAPNMAPYNLQQLRALQKFYDIDIIAPIPWLTRIKNTIPFHRMENGINIYHPTYFYTPGCLRSLYGKFFSSSVKSVITRSDFNNNFDLIYASWIYPDGWAAAKIAGALKVPIFVKVHGTDVNRLCPGGQITRLTLEVANKASGIICVSYALKSKLSELGAPVCKLQVLYNGVDKSIFHPKNRNEIRRQLGIRKEQMLVLFVGNLKREKGLAELIKAFKIVSDDKSREWHLVIIGKGSYEQEIVRQVETLNLTNKVRLLGSLPLKEIALWMNASSVLCLPSYMEGVPNVVLEALSCGTNIVATNVGGIPELDNGSGQLKLVPPKSVEPLAEALQVMALNEFDGDSTQTVSSWQENAEQLSRIFFNRG